MIIDCRIRGLSLMDMSESYIDLFPSNYRDAILHQQDFYLQFPVYSQDVESIFMKLIRGFLSRHDVLYLRDVIVTIVKELITNAVKANAKRLYFKNKGLMIDNAEDYEIGMSTFKKDVLHHDSFIFREIAKTNLRVRVLFISDNGALKIKVINNIPIVPSELAKVEARIRKAYEYTDITQAFTDALDDSEGAGLGLIMAILVFKSAGFSPNDFTIQSDGSKTVSSITLYQRKNRHEVEHKVANEILKEIELIPSFPENIRQIEQKCSDPECPIADIAECIKKDPGLATSILKLANSAGYVIVRRIETIEDAIKIIGVKGVKTLLVASGVQHIMEKRYAKYKVIWEDAYKKAFYAHKIAIQLKNNTLSETAYLGALLSETGKIVLLSVDRDVTDKITDIAGIKDIANVDILEEMTLGISHPTLGALITKKWQFSDSLVQSIEYYLRPYIAPEEYKELIYIIHLAHIYTEIEKKKYRFELVDDEVLEFFHLTHKETFDKLHSILKQTYVQKNTIK